MATVTITLKCKGKGKGIEWHPKKPTASEGDVVRWECEDGPWWIVFKTGNGPLFEAGLNSKKGRGNAKGSKVKVKGPKRYHYAAAIWNAAAQDFCTADPPLDIVPASSSMQPRSAKKAPRSRKAQAKKGSRAKR